MRRRLEQLAAQQANTLGNVRDAVKDPSAKREEWRTAAECRAWSGSGFHRAAWAAMAGRLRQSRKFESRGSRARRSSVILRGSIVR
jgi:hypothetical protein